MRLVPDFAMRPGTARSAGDVTRLLARFMQSKRVGTDASRAVAVLCNQTMATKRKR